MSERLSPPVKKGIRSIAKGIALAIFWPAVAVYNGAQTLYQLYKGNAKKCFSYFVGTITAGYSQLSRDVYEAFLWLTGLYRPIANEKLPHDNPRYDPSDYLSTLGYGSRDSGATYKLPKTFYPR